MSDAGALSPSRAPAPAPRRSNGARLLELTVGRADHTVFEPAALALLVLPSLVSTPVLWLAAALAAAGAGAWVVLAIGGVTGIAASAWAGAAVARRGGAALGFVCAVFAGLGSLAAALSAAVADETHLFALVLAVTATSGHALLGLARHRPVPLIAGIVAVNVVWAADAVWLIVLGMRALLGDTCAEAGGCGWPLD